MQKFKVLSGPQFGAMIDVAEDTRITISNQMGADIFLEGLSNVTQECCFHIQENCLQFDNLSNTLELANRDLILSGEAYSLPCFFYFDGIEVAVGEESEIMLWPDSGEIVNEDLHNNQINPLLTDIEHYAEVSKKLARKQQIYQGFKSGYRFIAPLVLFIRTQLNKLYRKNPKYFLICSLVLGLSCIGTSFLVRELIIDNQAEMSEQSYQLLAQRLKSRLTTLPTKYLNLSLQPSGKKYSLDGLIQDNKDTQFLKAYFNIYSSILTFHLTTIDEAIAKIKLGFANVKIANLKIIYDSTSQNIVISGLALNGMNSVNDAQITINNYLPAVSNLDFSKIYDFTQLQKDLDDALKNISGTLTTSENLNAGEFVIHGYLTQGQLNQLNTLVATLQGKYSPVAIFKLDIQDAMKALPFNISSVYMGNPGYIVTDNNQFVFIGGEIHGFRLVKITSEKIILSGKYNLEIPLSQMASSLSATNDSAVDKPSSREQLLQEEASKIKDNLTKEQQLLTKIKQYKDKIKDSEITGFLQEEMAMLEESIKNKQSDLSYLNTSKGT